MTWLWTPRIAGKPGAIAAFTLAACLASTGCSIRGLAVNALADSLAGSGDVFASDEDPELIRDALPFALKTIETLLAENPDHRGLLLSACKGFTQYSYAFVEFDAERLEEVDYQAASEMFDRALKLYLRGRDYCLRSLEIESPGIRERLESDPDEALTPFGEDSIELLFWTGASWGAAVSIGVDRPEVMVDLPAVRVLIERVLALDESWNEGAAHGVMMSLEALPEAMGGSVARAREEFARALELSGGNDASLFVGLAESVSVPAQDWREFQDLLEQALAVDVDAEPSRRLVNILSQRRAVWLLERGDELFIDYGDKEGDG